MKRIVLYIISGTSLVLLSALLVMGLVEREPEVKQIEVEIPFNGANQH